MGRRARLSLLVACVSYACADDTQLPGDAPYAPPAEACAPVDVDSPRTFHECSTGSGIFGRWTVDESGLPAYDYGLDENADARASFYNTENRDRRDHWFSFGNARVTALAYNDGYVEVTMQDRGETYLDKLDEAQGNYAGGFGYVDDGTSTWCTAYEWRPPGAVTTRRFGMGYVETSMLYHGLKVTRVTYAPAGDVPAVLTDVTIENTTDQQRSIKHYEYWDVARRPIEIDWLVSGNPLTSVPANTAAARDARNGMFQEHVAFDASTGILGMRRAYVGSEPRPAEDAPSPVDDYPADPFLAALIAPVDGLYTHQDSFFGSGGAASPDAVTRRLPGEAAATPDTNGLGQPRMFAVRSDLVVPAHAKQSLRFAYGFAPMGGDYVVQSEWQDPGRDMRTQARTDLESHLLYFATNRSGPEGIGGGALQRELAWHAAQIEASVAWREYWQHYVVPQGSAYLYLHGADGALRDLALFTLPLDFTDPQLSHEELLSMMGMQFAADKRFSYAFQGHGMLDDALGIHAHPSDLDIFFLWALTEYVGVTGEASLLDEPAPYYPKEALPSAIVWDHVVDSVRHLFDVVGTGAHGLVKVGDGDWSDGIVFQAPNRQLAIDQGESVPNTQMAVAVLPKVADLVEPRDKALASEIRTRVAALRAALPQTYNGTFFGRAYFGDDKLFEASSIDLESQVWALIGGSVASDADRAHLVSAIAESLDDPSPTGATLTPGGQVWPAISGLLTWGYALSDPVRAFDHLAKNTMAAHALTFPSLWYGIWSGPDGLDGAAGARPGEAWFSAATPMTDFPVQNANQHVMPLLALLRVCGIEGSASGLVIAPHLDSDFSLETQVLDLSRRGSLFRGTYRPPYSAPRTIELRAPRGRSFLGVTLGGQPVTIAPAATDVTLQVPALNGGAEDFAFALAP